jgi:hypothetical protein
MRKSGRGVNRRAQCAELAAAAATARGVVMGGQIGGVDVGESEGKLRFASGLQERRRALAGAGCVQRQNDNDNDYRGQRQGRAERAGL